MIHHHPPPQFCCLNISLSFPTYPSSINHLKSSIFTFLLLRLPLIASY
jgi:hypothetical protein